MTITSLNLPKDDADRLLDNLEDRIVSFVKAKEDLLRDLDVTLFGVANGSDLHHILRAYLFADRLLDHIKSVSTVCNSRQPDLATQAAKKMTADDTDSIVKFGYKFSPGTKRYIDVNKDNKPLVLMWLKLHTEGKELVREDYHPTAFGSFINKLIDEEGYSKDSQEPSKKLPEVISTFEKPILTVRKVKG